MVALTTTVPSRRVELTIVEELTFDPVMLELITVLFCSTLLVQVAEFSVLIFTKQFI